MQERRTAFALLTFVFLTHALSPSVTSSDSHWIVPQMVSIFTEGNTDVNEFTQHLRDHHWESIDCVDSQYRITMPDRTTGCPPNNHAYVRYPFATAVVALPALVGLDLVLRVIGHPILRLFDFALQQEAARSVIQKVTNRVMHRPDPRLSPVIRGFFNREYAEAFPVVEMVLGSFLMGVASVVVFFTGLQFLSRRRAIVLALLFAYGTAAWSTGSRALWQHGPEMLMIAIAIYLLVTNRVPWSAIPLVLAYFIRPTGGIAVALIGLYVVAHRRGEFGKWLLLAAATIAPFLAYDFALYRQPLQPYFTQQGFLKPTLENVQPFLVALAGQAVSPSRGVLIYSPFFVFSLVGFWMAIRRNWQIPLTYYLGAIVVLHWIAISAFADWTAGHCFGARYFSDVTPIFIFFLIPVLNEWPSFHRATRAAFVFTALLAVGIHLRGAVDWEVQRWNSPGVTPARAWDWRDPQFLHGLIK